MLNFHAHLYFQPPTRDSALKIRQALANLPEVKIQLGQINEGPRGPHTVPSYEIYIRNSDFAAVVQWLV